MLNGLAAHFKLISESGAIVLPMIDLGLLHYGKTTNAGVCSL